MSAAAPQNPATPWLFGPWVDISFGYGAVYLVSVPLFVLLSVRGLGTPAEWVTPALILALSIPHYGATLLRVYERAEDRRRYVVFTVWISLLLLALFVASFSFVLVGSLLVTAYLTWSPWHFSGQNYGIFLMFLRRGGNDPAEIKRPLYISFILSAGLAMLSMHMATGKGSFAPLAYDASETFTMLRLGIPASAAVAAASLAALAWLGCIGVVASRLRGAIRLRDAGPLITLLAMQGLWYLPSLALVTRIFDPGVAGIALTAIWIAVAHAAQYLWVTYYYARRENRQPNLARYYGKAMLAGSLLLLPMLILAPGLMGGITSQAAGVGLLTIAVMNLHHFVLDGAIWKLRDGRVARILLRSENGAQGQDAMPIEPPPRWRLRPLVLALWTIAAISFLTRVELIRLTVAATRESVEATAIHRTARSLAWFGKDSSGLWARVGNAYEEAGDPSTALRAYSRSVKLDETPQPFIANRLAWLLMDGPGATDARALDQARQLAEYLVRRLGETRPEGYQTLAAVHERAGRWPEAAAAATQALRVAEGLGDETRAKHLRQQLAHYREQRRAGSGDAVRMEPAAAPVYRADGV